MVPIGSMRESVMIKMEKKSGQMRELDQHQPE